MDKAIHFLCILSACSGVEVAIAHNALDQIAGSLEELVPVHGVLSSEYITKPLDKERTPTYHVDAFIYDEEAVNRLVEEKKIPREFCTKCGSFDIKPVDYVSHSLSRRQAAFIFQSMIQEYLEGKTVLDVGSRLGSALYGAYYFGHSNKIIGIEVNKELCEIQRKIIGKYNLGDRIEVIEGNIRDHEDIVESSDVIILNNVFEHFLQEDKEADAWKFLRRHISKPGTLLVTSPTLENVFNRLKIPIDISNWVKEVFLDDPLSATYLYEHSDLSELHLYKVL